MCCIMAIRGTLRSFRMSVFIWPSHPRHIGTLKNTAVENNNSGIFLIMKNFYLSYPKYGLKFSEYSCLGVDWFVW
jgi:hypothetical protein